MSTSPSVCKCFQLRLRVSRHRRHMAHQYVEPSGLALLLLSRPRAPSRVIYGAPQRAELFSGVLFNVNSEQRKRARQTDRECNTCEMWRFKAGEMKPTDSQPPRMHSAVMVKRRDVSAQNEHLRGFSFFRFDRSFHRRQRCFVHSPYSFSVFYYVTNATPASFLYRRSTTEPSSLKCTVADGDERICFDV